MSLLKIGISSRALFDLVESHEIFKKNGIEEYSNYQKKNENKPLEKGVAFDLVEKLLKMNNKKEQIRMFLPFSWVICAVISFAYINSHLINT